MLGESVWILMNSNLCWFIEGQTYFSTSCMPKWVWSSMNHYRIFFGQFSTLPPIMHQNLPNIGRCCKQNSQVLTKSHVELEDSYGSPLFYWMLNLATLYCWEFACSLPYIESLDSAALWVVNRMHTICCAGLLTWLSLKVATIIGLSPASSPSLLLNFHTSNSQPGFSLGIPEKNVPGLTDLFWGIAKDLWCIQ